MSAKALDSTTLLISWSPPPDEHHNGVIRKYQIVVSELETGTVFILNSTNTPATLSPLHPNYVYVCAVAAFTTDEGPYSTNVTVRMPEDGKSEPHSVYNLWYFMSTFCLISPAVPASSPGQLSVKDITADSSVVSWSPLPLEDQNGVITGYIVNVSTVPAGEVVQLLTSATELHLDFLMPHTAYSVVVAAETSVGHGPFSTVLLFQTNEDGKLL